MAIKKYYLLAAFGIATIFCFVNEVKAMNEKSNNCTKATPIQCILWSIIDNFEGQLGRTIIWKNGEASYGLRNGIGWYPRQLNFKHFKIGFFDAHINIINAIFHINRFWDVGKFFFHDILFNIHLLSFKFLKCVRVKIISIFGTIYYYKDGDSDKRDIIIPFIEIPHIFSRFYFALSPRIEIDISELSNHLEINWK